MAHIHTYLINGSFDTTISPLDRGFAYGDGIFRTMKVTNGLPEYWPQHYQKLVADCAAINIVCPSAELLMSDIQALYTPTDTAVCKIIITRGEGERGYAPPAITAPMRVVLKTALRTYPANYLSEGVSLHVCKTQLARQPQLAGIKHLNRLENVLARMEWTDTNIADGILCDAENNVIECTAANIFARFGNTLVTPCLINCGVTGITRQHIIDIAHLVPLIVKIEPISLTQLFLADEVIICSSIYGAWQVKKIMQHTWAPNNLASTLRKLIKT